MNLNSVTTCHAAAKHFNVHVETIRRLMRSGTVRSYSIAGYGRQRFLSKSDLEKYFTMREVEDDLCD